MQCWKSQIPPPLSTRPQIVVVVGFLVLCWPKRKETRPSKIPQQNKNSKTSEKLTCTCSPNPQKSKNIKITTQNLPKSTKISQNLSKSMKNTKNLKKNTKSKGKRPKAKVSSHNACRFGYPFFLSPSDDDAMLEIPNPTPSVHQTPGCCYWFFGFVLTKKKRNTTQQNSPAK